jgi:hypothetical protein
MQTATRYFNVEHLTLVISDPYAIKIKPLLQFQRESINYELISAILHSGSNSYGHYIAITKEKSNVWSVCNDSSIKMVNEDEINKYLRSWVTTLMVYKVSKEIVDISSEEEFTHQGTTVAYQQQQPEDPIRNESDNQIISEIQPRHQEEEKHEKHEKTAPITTTIHPPIEPGSEVQPRHQEEEKQEKTTTTIHPQIEPGSEVLPRHQEEEKHEKTTTTIHPPIDPGSVEQPHYQEEEKHEKTTIHPPAEDRNISNESGVTIQSNQEGESRVTLDPQHPETSVVSLHSHSEESRHAPNLSQQTEYGNPHDTPAEDNMDITENEF